MDSENLPDGGETVQEAQVELSTVPEAQVVDSEPDFTPETSKGVSDKPCFRVTALICSVLLMGAGGVLIGYGIYHSKIWTRTIHAACYYSVTGMYTCPEDARAKYVLPYCDDAVANASCTACKELCPKNIIQPAVPSSVSPSQLVSKCEGQAYIAAAEPMFQECSAKQIISPETQNYEAKFVDHGFLYSKCRYEINNDPKAADVESAVKLVILLIGCAGGGVVIVFVAFPALLAGLRMLPSLIVCVSVFSALLWLPYLAFGVLLIVARIIIGDVCKEFKNSVCTTSTPIKINGLNCDIDVACKGVDSVCNDAKSFFLTIGIPYAAAGIILFLYQYCCCTCCSGGAFSSGPSRTSKKAKDVEMGLDGGEVQLGGEDKQEGEEKGIDKDHVVTAELAVLEHEGDAEAEEDDHPPLYPKVTNKHDPHPGSVDADRISRRSHILAAAHDNDESAKKEQVNKAAGSAEESPKETEGLEGALNSIGEFWKQIEELTGGGSRARMRLTAAAGLRPKSEGQASTTSTNSDQQPKSN